MGPFPHDAPKAVISDVNPAGTDGFEFVEFAHPEPQALRDLFSKMGYQHTATHKTKAVELWQQGDITYVINAEPGSRWRCALSRNMGRAARRWRGAWSMRRPRSGMRWPRGQRPMRATDKTMDVPAIVGIGGSLIYFIDQYYDTSPYNAEFDWIDKAHPRGRRVLLPRSPDPQRPQGQHGRLVRLLRRHLQLQAKSGSSISRASSPGCSAAR